MKIVFDLQGTHGAALYVRGVVYEIDVMNEDGTGQHFGLEGSINSLQDFFISGLALIEEALENEEAGEADNLGPIYFGPESEELENL